MKPVFLLTAALALASQASRAQPAPAPAPVGSAPAPAPAPASAPAAPAPQTESPDAKKASSTIPARQYPKVDSEGRATVRILAPQAQAVRVSLGGGTVLTKEENGVWSGTTAPLDPGFHYYNINVDGATVADPSSEGFFGSGWLQSGIEVPEKGVDFYDAKDVPHGEIRQRFYFSKSTNQTKSVYVYTPPDYDSNPTARYPVLYLQHGAGEDRRAWAIQGRTNFILDNLIAGGKAKPMIIVISDGGLSSMFAPGVPGPGDPAPAARGGGGRAGAGAPGAARGGAPGGARGAGGPPGGGRGGRGGGGGTPFAELAAEIVPMIDATYRTLTDRESRAMAGLSMGGAQTYTETQAHLDKFAYVGIFSAPFGAPQPATGYNGLMAKPEEFAKQVKVFFISRGSKEPDAGLQAHNMYEQAGIKHTYYVAPGTAHEFQTWRKSLYEFAPLLFRN
jgi:enterochelin esterase-like enzyme